MVTGRRISRMPPTICVRERESMNIGRRSCLGLLAATALGGKARAAGDVGRLGLLHTLSPAPFFLAAGRGYFAAEGAGAVFRLGLLHTLSPAPFYLAQERGYFAAEGVDVQFRFFESAQPIAAAAVAGDIDVGVTALTGGFFSLAGKGALRVIGGALHEQKGFDLTAVLVSKKAYDAGLTSLDKLGGHSF